MSKRRSQSVEIIVPVVAESVLGLERTLTALSHQTAAGFSTTVVTSPECASDVRHVCSKLGSAMELNVLQSAQLTRGGVLADALGAGTTDLVAVVSPGELLTRASIHEMTRALADSLDADIACVQSRASTETLTPGHVPDGDRGWPKATKVIDVRDRWLKGRVSLRGTLVRRSAIPSVRDEALVGRDFDRALLLEMQMENSRVAFVSGERVELLYYDEYQPRLFLGATNTDWYTKSLETLWIPRLSKYGSAGPLPRFVQKMALTAVALRFMANKDNLNKQVLFDDALAAFFDACAQVLHSVDDDLILSAYSAKKLRLTRSLALTLYLVKQRGAEVHYTIEEVETTPGSGSCCPSLVVDGHPFQHTRRQRVRVSLVDYDPQSSNLIIDGRVDGLAWLAGEDYSANVSWVDAGGHRQKVKVRAEHREWYALVKYFGVATTKNYAFRLSIPIPEGLSSLRISIACGKDHRNPLALVFVGHYTRVARFPAGSWWAFGDYYLRYSRRRLVVKPKSMNGILKSEIRLLLSLLRGSRHKSRRSYFRLAAVRRSIYWLTAPLYRGKTSWFFVDKVYKGGDSSEYLYRHSLSKTDGIKKYYVIGKATPDYSRLRTEGLDPLKAGTMRHLLAFLHADLMFASNSTVCSLNGLKGWKSSPYRGLIDFDGVCVQHGLSVQNIAVAQNRLIDNTHLYLLASEVERGNLSRPVYAYDDYPEALQLTGIPRYDGLVNDDRKQILLHPTWRMQYAIPVLTHEGEARPYNPEFKQSAYFRVYASLIQNKQLIDCARETGYSIKYVLHPIASSQVSDFPESEFVEILGASGELNYEEVLTQSSLMVTDYSGVQFDFAYMRKPVLYYHNASLPPHYSEGVFRYDTMAFGEICREEQSLVDALCAYMRDGCQMRPEYRQRVDTFFAFDDRENCERAYQAALHYTKIRKERR